MTGCETRPATKRSAAEDNDERCLRQRRAAGFSLWDGAPHCAREGEEAFATRGANRSDHPTTSSDVAQGGSYCGSLLPACRPVSGKQFKGYTLNAFQVSAAEAIEAGKNVLLSAPTGSGKTLVAEYAIEQAVKKGRRAIYTSPIKALSNQKFRDFKQDGLDVGLMTGDLTLNADAPLVIMTTEIFRNAVFEDPQRFADTDFAIRSAARSGKSR
jgi:hypothetical protein